jgi:hypothetical protein
MMMMMKMKREKKMMMKMTFAKERKVSHWLKQT